VLDDGLPYFVTGSMFGAVVAVDNIELRISNCGGAVIDRVADKSIGLEAVFSSWTLTVSISGDCSRESFSSFALRISLLTLSSSSSDEEAVLASRVL